MFISCGVCVLVVFVSLRGSSYGIFGVYWSYVPVTLSVCGSLEQSPPVPAAVGLSCALSPPVCLVGDSDSITLLRNQL